jgi:predicted nucleic acid-binding protein
MKYADASALLRLLFQESGTQIPLDDGDRIVSSRLVEVETFRAVDRERLLGRLNDAETARKRRELGDLLLAIDLAAVDDPVLERARASFAVNVRALDAIHVATAEVLGILAEGEGLEFWTHDERQATAALSRGLSVRGLDQPSGT